MSDPTGAHCPVCAEEYEAEHCDEPELTTYHGEDGPVDVSCDGCGHKFQIQETVIRLWETVSEPGENGPDGAPAGGGLYG